MTEFRVYQLIIISLLNFFSAFLFRLDWNGSFDNLLVKS